MTGGRIAWGEITPIATDMGSSMPGRWWNWRMVGDQSHPSEIEQVKSGSNKIEQNFYFKCWPDFDTVTLLDQKINAPLDLRTEFVNNEALFTIEVKRREKLKIDKLEHVVVVLSIAFAKRGELRLEVTSPHGTKSTILDKRPNDKSRKGFDHFEFLSVHFWDER